MRTFVTAAGLLALLAGFTTVVTAGGRAKADNVPPQGFTALFNGKDLNGWQGVVPLNERKKLSKDQYKQAVEKANKKVLPHWKIVDGALAYDGKGNSLQTAKDYGDFELFVDWKIHAKGDSGIYLRGQPQVQIWDSDARAEGDADKGKGSGGLWNNPAGSKGKQPLVNADRPVGEWNTFRIIMKGNNATIWLNGKLVVDDAPLANYWEKGKPLPATGPIELQHHGDQLWFKNIYIKEL